MTDARVLTYKAIRKAWNKCVCIISRLRTMMRFAGNGVKCQSFTTNGVPYVMVALGGKMQIGKNFKMNNGPTGNPIGCFQPCTFVVDRNAQLKIGDNVGISQCALIAHANIEIQNNVKIGGGVCVYTTDFHSLNPVIRASADDTKHKVCKPVVIEENAFIGAHSILLKGVHIGKNSIIGAGSVVTKPVPANQIWAGNPAKFIKNIPSPN